MNRLNFSFFTKTVTGDIERPGTSETVELANEASTPGSELASGGLIEGIEVAGATCKPKKVVAKFLYRSVHNADMKTAVKSMFEGCDENLQINVETLERINKMDRQTRLVKSHPIKGGVAIVSLTNTGRADILSFRRKNQKLHFKEVVTLEEEIKHLSSTQTNSSCWVNTISATG